MRRFCITILQFIFISVCFCEFSENKDKFINAFVNHLNSLPDQLSFYEEAELIKAEELGEKEFYLEVKLKASDQNNVFSSKYQNCSGILMDEEDGTQISFRDTQCSDYLENWTENMEELVTDVTTVDGPVQLENEVQTENMSTSGERFIAVRAPCISCASVLDTNTAGVKELATLGIKQLDQLEPGVHHTLNDILLVERQVQVVGGVRFTITLTVDYDNCTLNNTEGCNYQKTCKIAVLEKPWQRMPDGSKFRTIRSNNCTEEWIFDENDFTTPEDPKFNNQSNDINPTPEYDKTGGADDIVRAIHNNEVQAQPSTEKTLTNEQMKELEDQIIPVPKANQPTDNKNYVVTDATQNDKIAETKSINLEAAKPSAPISTQQPEPSKVVESIPDDKKKAIDELMNFFDFAGFKNKADNEDVRTKRDYGSDLQILNMAENYQNMKTKIKNAQFIHKLAQIMVDYLNEMDIEVKTRILKEVISAEEEIEKDQRYFYVQARVVVPCEKVDCKNKEVKVCNGIIDVTEDQPSILYTVCNPEQKNDLGKLKNIRRDDPVLLKFLNSAVKKIDVESKLPYALRIRKVLDASTQRVSGTLTKITIEVEYTECFKAVPLFKRKNCTVLENLGYKVCDIEVLQRHWLKETKMTYVCTERPVDEIFINDPKNDVTGPSHKNVDDARILEYVQEALQYLEESSNRNNKQKLIEVKSVLKQPVAGLLTNVVFIVGYTECPSEFKEDVMKCKLLENEPLRNCSVEVWERAWLENGRRMNVTCEEYKNNVEGNSFSEKENNTKRTKRSIVTKGNEIEEDPKMYTKLAQDCLTNYMVTYEINEYYKLIGIHKAVKVNESGDLTKLDFEAGSTGCAVKDGYPIKSNCEVDNTKDTLSCHADIWTKPELNSRVMNVNCQVNEKKIRRKRNALLGGEKIEDASDPKYEELAKKSLSKYALKKRKSQFHKVVTVDQVTTQIVSGIKTKINFKASPTDCQVDSRGKPTTTPCEIKDPDDVLHCYAEIYEQPWKGKEDIHVNCHPGKSRGKRFIQMTEPPPGGEKTQDPNDPKYKQLAQECLAQYVTTNGITQPHKIIEISKVTTQVVAGSMTRIDFKVQGPDSVMMCHSEVWEQPWLHKKEINVNCSPETPRKKRGIPGGQTEQDPNDPKYTQLVKDSLAQYVTTNGITQPHKIIEISKVTTQVVSGTKTRIDFKIQGPGSVMMCHSEVWEQLWLHKKEINVNCSPETPRKKRGIPGEQTEQDPNDPKYTQLVKDSLAQYVTTTGITQPHKVTKIYKVTTQVVAGILTRIDFKVQGPDSVMMCHSEVWEQPWLHKKEINVNCSPETPRKKRGIPGGQTEQDPNDPKYTQLVKDSLAQYVTTNGITQPHKIIEISKVTTQVVSGTKTRIDFKIQGPGSVMMCHSEVWEQLWLHKKEIKVKCFPETSREMRELAGGQTEKDPNDPKYMQLAQDSLAQYETTTGITQPHKVTKIYKVTTQVVAGILTRIDFKVQVSDNVLMCHSKILERSWLNITEIEVTCNAPFRRRREVQLSNAVRSLNRYQNMNTRTGRYSSRPGGYVEQDPSNPEYSKLAAEALNKYQRVKKSKFLHKVIDVNHVVKQVVSGNKYKIDFTAAPTDCAVNVSKTTFCELVTNTTFYCRTEIWDRPWLKRKQINVFCNTDDPSEESDSHEIGRKKRSFDNVSDFTDKPAKILTPIDKVIEIPEDPEIEDNSIDISNRINDSHYVKKSEFFNSKEYLQAAEDSLREYERLSNVDVIYKVVKIYYVNQNNDASVRLRLQFSASPTNCTKTEDKNSNHCQFIQPKSMISCQADIRLAMLLESNLIKNIDVKCTQQKKRSKRQAPLDDYIEEDLIYYYADRLISKLNSEADTQNLYKLVTIHDVRRTLQMRKTPLVRMYFEVAKSFCLRDEAVLELSTCNEIEGLQHMICFARVWPSRYDEIVIDKSDIVCEENIRRFISMTGFSTNDLLSVSMMVLNRDGPYKKFQKSIGETYLIPSLDYSKPFKLSFFAAGTNCTKEYADTLDPKTRALFFQCPVDVHDTAKVCNSQIFASPNSRVISYVNVSCSNRRLRRTRRSIPLSPKILTEEDVTIQGLVQESLHQLEMVSVHRYKQRVLVINRYSTKIDSGKQTTIDFDVGYTNCLKYEWVDNITSCDFLEHLPRRHCVSIVWEKLWTDNSRRIEVNCDDDETPLEANLELESAQSATSLAKEALKRIEYKYPHPRRQIVTRIFTLEKQMVAGIHYRMKLEVGYSTCMALSVEDDCKLDPKIEQRKFCRVNVWIRPWTSHPPSYRVTCDYHDGATAEIYREIQAQQLFSHFLMTYKPSYINDHTEMRNRFKIFEVNVKKIHELNVYDMGTARYAVTQFTDLTEEEFRSKYLGLNLKLRDENQVPMPQAEIPSVNIPDAFDWRDHDAVTEVKDQGQCGSCWAFSVTGNIEGQWKRHSGKLVSLSEQELVDCDKLDQGCNGGLPDNAYRAIEQLGGLETESDYPYEGEDDKCLYNATLSRVQISGAVNISSNETDMAKWLYKNGPISIGINANAMQFYVGGISHPWKMLCNPSNLDHGVLIVGYGRKDYPLFKKKLPYWIIKNSWGKMWGEQGYYRVYRGDGTCGVNQMASSAVV